MVLTPTSPTLAITASEQLADWLHQRQISLAFTTYQTNRLFFIGSNNGRIAAHERLFDKPMGLYAQEDRLYMSTRYQIWRLDNLLSDNETYGECDRLYVPRTAHVTGDLNVHDLVLDNAQNLIFVNTDFSCLATLSDDYSFVPLWQPPFISKLVAEDRCHLNGLALRDGQPAYVTACSTTDTAAGWRNCRDKGGAVIDVQTNEIVATELSMPHSPRWYRDKLWLLNSGTGELGYIESGQFVPLTFCPGFVRGLAFWDKYAVVGLSKLRARPFTGLVIEERLVFEGKVPHCGLMIIDLDSGEIVHWLHLEGVVEELFDIVVLSGVCQPKAIGFQKDEIERLVTFPGSGGIVITKPTAERPSLGARAPVAGLPRTNETLDLENQEELATNFSFSTKKIPPYPCAIKYQRVYHLNPTNAVAYDNLTFPSLQQRWLTQPQRGELLGISASVSVSGEMVGMAIAELLGEGTAELISLFVVPQMRQQGIGTRLVHYLERELARQGYERMQAIYPASNPTNLVLFALWSKLNWQSEPLSQTVQTAFKAIA
jgi:uncharacterized protein (TIGR03032 family)